MTNFKKTVKNQLIKSKVLEKIFIDNVEYRVIDKTSILPNIKSTRNLCFMVDNRIHNHSSIHINPKHRFQPAYTTVQTIINLWCEYNTLNNALVLGCAGCTIPRFIGLSYPKSKTIGVELCKEFIEIAKKHFLLNEIENQFELVQGDAINYIKNYNLDYKQNIIYVDIFCENKIIPDIFTEEFIKAIYNCTKENGAVIINILGKNIEETKEFLNIIRNPFGGTFYVKSRNAQFLILSKNSKGNNISEFSGELQNLKDTSVYNLS